MKIIIAAHKECIVPKDSLFLPIQAGATSHIQIEGFIPDNTGDNISSKNALYSELTVLYWAWKNLNEDYIGLCHYRRYFQITQEKAYKILGRNDVILPPKRHYFIETVYSQFIHAHGREPMDQTEKIIREKYPDYLSAFKTIMNRRRLHLYNMFLMSSEQTDRYCSWLFGILSELENRLVVQTPRIMGYLSERLLDVWIEKNKLNYYECRIRITESQHWGKKIESFMKRKFTENE